MIQTKWTKWTKGNWEVGTPGNGAINHVYVDDVFGSSICSVPLSGSMLCVEERVANLNLISAAPDMHAALALALTQLEHSVPGDCYSSGPNTGNLVQDHVVCPGCQAVAIVKAAMNKAEGQKPADSSSDGGQLATLSELTTYNQEIRL